MAKRAEDFKFNRAVKTIKWFHPRVTSKSAEAILTERGTVGSFIVHPSATTAGCYTISVKREDDVTHVRIQNGGDFYDLYGGEVFATLSELVQYYVEGNETLKERNGAVVPLTQPLHDEEPASERWYHGKISGKDAEKALETRGTVGSFLVRESMSKPGEYVITVRTSEKIVHALVRFEAGKYDVGQGEQFNNLPDLVDFYTDFPITETCGRVLELKQPLNTTRIIGSGLDIRMEELDCSSGLKGEGFYLEFEELQQQDAMNVQTQVYHRREGQKAENKPKNRFKNILPYDHSRIVLRDGDPNIPSTDYINANAVRITGGDIKDHKLKTYIATQGCLNHTITDFWRMIYQENSQIIAMTTKVVEGGKNKCARYWPDENKPELVKDTYDGEIVVKWVSEQTTEDYILREMILSKRHNDKSLADNPRPIYQYHFTAWPDKQVPKDPSKLLKYIAAINKKYNEIEEQRPITVHCSAGIGRTGTTIILDYMLDLIKEFGVNSEIDIAKAIQTARTQRSGLVQTDTQYKFIYLSIRYYLSQLGNQTTDKSKSSRKTVAAPPRQDEVYENVPKLDRRATRK